MEEKKEITLVTTLIPLPLVKGYTVYTKENCKFCTLVKNLLKEEEHQIIECDKFLQQDRADFLKTMEGRIKYEYKTFPMIFYDGHFIGGYNETKIYYHKQHLSFEEIEYNEKQSHRFNIDNRLLSSVLPSPVSSGSGITVFPPVHNNETCGKAVCTCLLLPCICLLPSS